MEKGDRTPKVFEFSISSSDGFDFLNLAVDSFCSGIRLLMARRITDAFLVSFKHLGDPDDLLYGFFIYAFKP